MWKDLFCKDVYFSLLRVSPLLTIIAIHAVDNWCPKLWQKKKNKLKRAFVVFTIFVQHCYNEEFHSQKQISSPHMLGASFVLFLFLCFLKSFTSSIITVSVIMPLKLMVNPALTSMLRSQSVWCNEVNPFYESILSKCIFVKTAFQM